MCLGLPFLVFRAQVVDSILHAFKFSEFNYMWYEKERK